MPSLPSTTTLLDYWYAALASPIGIYLISPDPLRLKGLLYNARAKSGDPSIYPLILRTSPYNPKGELWIVKPQEGE